MREPTDIASCWLHYLRIFALQTPFGLPVKITVNVSQFVGPMLARDWKLEPYDVVDAYGRPAKQIETEDHLIAVEWLVPENRSRCATRSPGAGSPRGRRTRPVSGRPPTRALLAASFYALDDLVGGGARFKFGRGLASSHCSTVHDHAPPEAAVALL
jgi:hypothetical protein